MYKSLEEICEMTTKEGKPFWKIVQELLWKTEVRMRAGGNRRGKNACGKRSRNFALWKIYWKSDGKSFKDR